MKLKVAVLALLLFSMTSCLKTKTEGVMVLNPESFEQKMNDDDIQLVDVRTPEEFAEGHIANAVNININGDSFDAEITKLDKNKPVMVYCKMGGRSAKAAASLREKGFKNISDLDGGITGWMETGKPIED